ncbi:MAG: glycosyltransferase [Gemmatimonadaceae bacterium]
MNDALAPVPSAGVPPEISVVLPCYRSAPIARRSVTALQAFLEASGRTWEIVVVDDGGGDFAGSLSADKRVRLVVLPSNRGKGAAVRAGMLAARGRVRIYSDVDPLYSPDLFLVIADYVLRRGFHMVVGDRTLPDAKYAAAIAWQRRWASALFSTFVGKLVTGGFFDTQCGLKGMRADVAELIFGSTRIDRFAFDVEVLYLALIARIDVKRIPVRLINNETSSVHVGRDSLRMLYDVFRMKYYRMRGSYRTRALAEVVSADFRRAEASVHGERLDALPAVAAAGPSET